MTAPSITPDQPGPFALALAIIDRMEARLVALAQGTEVPE